MLTYISLTCIVKLAKLLLRKPYCLTGKLHINASFAVFALVYDYLVVVINDSINSL